MGTVPSPPCFLNTLSSEMRFSPTRNAYFQKPVVSPKPKANFADSDGHIRSLGLFDRHAFPAHVSLALYRASKLQEHKQHPPPYKKTRFCMRFALLLRRCWRMVLLSCPGHVSEQQELARTPRRIPYRNAFVTTIPFDIAKPFMTAAMPSPTLM